MNNKMVQNKVQWGGAFNNLSTASFCVPFFGINRQSSERLCLFCALNGGNINE